MFESHEKTLMILAHKSIGVFILADLHKHVQWSERFVQTLQLFLVVFGIMRALEEFSLSWDVLITK